MKLLNIIEIPFEKVLETYEKENGKKNDQWEINNLEKANKKFGSWINCKIPILEIREVVMPHYKYGGSAVIPAEGALLSEAYEFFNNNRKRFEIENSQFCKRVEIQKNIISKSKRVKTLYLSQEPLFIGLSYSGLTKFKGKITHLDGFHRLIALMDIEKKPESVESFIAVYNNFFDNLFEKLNSFN